jgi:hypothetical protein
MAGRTTPRELKVVAVMRKNTTLIAAKVTDGRMLMACPRRA